MISLREMYQRAGSLLRSRKNIQLLTEKGVERAEITLPNQNHDLRRIREAVLLSPWCVAEDGVKFETEGSDNKTVVKFSAIGKGGVEKISSSVMKLT